jgi:hypothetical protein
MDAAREEAFVAEETEDEGEDVDPSAPSRS